MTLDNQIEKQNHVLAYVSNSKIADWKRLMNPQGNRKFPFLYGSNDTTVFARKVNKGTVLWVIGATPDGRPPSLVAKLDVIGRAECICEGNFGIPEGVIRTFRKKFCFVAIGHPVSSQFYGHNNASKAILNLRMKWSKKEPRTLSEQPLSENITEEWKSSYATPLNRPAEIVSDPEPLYKLHRASALCVFISWKRDDLPNKKDIRKLAYALADKDLFVWLDVLTLPYSIAIKEKVNKDSKILESLLLYGYRKSKGLLAIETKNYGSPGIKANWTEKEWEGDFDDRNEPSPLPYRTAYRIEKSVLANQIEANCNPFSKETSWPELAKSIHKEIILQFS